MESVLSELAIANIELLTNAIERAKRCEKQPKFKQLVWTSADFDKHFHTKIIVDYPSQINTLIQRMVKKTIQKQAFIN